MKIKSNCRNHWQSLADVLNNLKQMYHIIGMIHNLHGDLKQKDIKIQLLEERIDDLEQYAIEDDIVIVGLLTKYLSYASAASRGT